MAPYRQPDTLASAIGVVTTAAWSLASFASTLFALHLVLAAAVVVFQAADVASGTRRARRHDRFDWHTVLAGVARKLARWRWPLAGLVVDVGFGVTATIILQVLPGFAPAEIMLTIGQVGGVTVGCVWWLGTQEVASAFEHTGKTERRFFFPWLHKAGGAFERASRPVLHTLDGEDEASEPPR